MFYQEEGLAYVHVIVLLRNAGKSVSKKWWLAQRYHTRTYHASYSAVVPTLALSKLEPDISFTPPEYRKPAGRPSKQRKDRSHLNKTGNKHQCSSCGVLGHSFRTCERPSTQFRFQNHYGKAVAWTKQYNRNEIE